MFSVVVSVVPPASALQVLGPREVERLSEPGVGNWWSKLAPPVNAAVPVATEVSPLEFFESGGMNAMVNFVYCHVAGPMTMHGSTVKVSR
jgi:hypothetical protein